MRLTLAAALVLALAVGVAQASHCDTYTTTYPDGNNCNSGGQCWYWDNDFCQPECIFSFWVYEESNGIEGLQRGDEVVDDTCHGMIDSDTIIF